MLRGRSLIMMAMLGVLASQQASARTIEVTIDGLAYAPDHVLASVGDTVRWVNEDALAHTATAAGAFNVTIPPKGSARVRLKKPGQMEYRCRFHPNMKAWVDVRP
jgi:plastocyanin